MVRGKPPAAPRRPKQTKPPGGSFPTYPRWDLGPSEHVIPGLAYWGRVVLAFNHLSAADREVVEQAARRLGVAELKLLELISQVTAAPSILKRLLDQIAEIAGAAYLIGAHGGMTDTARSFFVRGHTAHMRRRLAAKNSGPEQELRAAIEQELKVTGGPSAGPFKDAEAILDGVNRRLKKRRQKPVSVWKIYHRLKPPT